VAGHIPGAVNLPASALVDESGRLRPPAEVVAAFTAAAAQAPAARGTVTGGTVTGGTVTGGTVTGGPAVEPEAVRSRPVGAYCGSGVTAAQTVLALHLAGIEASLYVGSWSEWCADGSRPVARGEQP
jgi:thiosulfate/3-mercaptopyruvate sulfurtransferase